MRIQKIGMRTVKTAFAVFLTILISQILNLKSPFFAGIAAVTAMQTSVSESFHVGRDRMRGTILGAIIALLFSLVAPENPLFIGIGIMIIIYICNLLQLKKSTQLSTIVFLSIILNYEEGSRIGYALYRTLDTLIGLIIGTLINYFILPPDIENTLIKGMDSLYIYSKDMIEEIIFNEQKNSLEKFKEDLITMDEDYKILKRDNKLNLHETCNISGFQRVLKLFETIYYHLGILSSLDGSFNINKSNKKSLQKLLQKNLPIQNVNNKNNLDLIYNYHLRKILDNMASIKTRIETLCK